MQETHGNHKLCKLWEPEWGSTWFTSSCSSSAKGVTILFRNPKKYEIIHTVSNHEGRYVLVQISIDDCVYTLCNIYAPNEDSPNFFERIAKIIDKNQCENLIIGGDLNLVLDTNCDRLNSKYNNKKACAFLKNFMEVYKFVDIWRARNPDKRQYSWCNRTRHGFSTSRIDMFLSSVGTVNKIEDCKISVATRMDHSLITVTIKDTMIK